MCCGDIYHLISFPVFIEQIGVTSISMKGNKGKELKISCSSDVSFYIENAYVCPFSSDAPNMNPLSPSFQLCCSLMLKNFELFYALLRNVMWYFL